MKFFDKDKWITVHPNGADNKGAHVKIDGETGETKAADVSRFNNPEKVFQFKGVPDQQPQAGYKKLAAPPEIVNASKKAVLIKGRGGGTFWLPKSHVAIENGRLTHMSEWIAREKGINPVSFVNED